MIIHTMEQRSLEWFKVRLGKITGSDFHTLLGSSETREKLIATLACERLIGLDDENSYISLDMQRGIEQEEDALLKYEIEKECAIKTIGFIEFDEWTGCSPDGLVGDDGMVEVKNHKPSILMRLFVTDEVEKKYYTQMQWGLYKSGRQWCDYIGHCRNMPLYVRRFTADAEYHEKLKDAEKRAIEDIKSYITNYELATRAA